MNILLSSYSINPYSGSENSVGWNWALQLSKMFCGDNDTIVVLTKAFNAAYVRRGIEENNMTNVQLVVVDVPKHLNWFREKHSIFHHMYYALWQHVAYKWAKHSKMQFDVIHHVTMGNYRFTGSLGKIKGPYKIFGPVAGGQLTPKSLKCYFSKQKVFEAIRELSNKMLTINPFYKHRLEMFDDIYVTNNETKTAMEKLINKKCKIMPEQALPADAISLPISPKNHDTINIIFVGRLIEFKGILLLIDVIKNIKTDVPFCLTIYGNGELYDTINQRINDYGLQEKVKLAGTVNHLKINEVYENADIFVHPSLRESGGTVFFEAMAHSLPIVALDMSWAHELSKFNCGLFVNINQSKDEIIKEFADNLTTFIEKEHKRIQCGYNGYKYANESLTWKNKVNIVYKKFL